MASKTDGMEKLKDSGQELLKNLGDKALDTVNDKLSGLTDKLTDIGEGGPIGKAVSKAGEASAKGDNPVMGGLKGAVVRDQGQGHRRRWWRRRWWQGDEVDQHHRDDRRRRAPQGRLQPVDRVRRLPELHEEGGEGRGRGGQQDHLQGADLPQPPHVGGDDPRADPRRAHRVALEGREGPRRRRGHLPRARAEPDAHPRRPRVLPAGVVREDRQHLGGPGPTCPGRAAPLPPPRDDPHHPRPRRGRGLARPHRGQRGRGDPRGGPRARGAGGAGTGRVRRAGRVRGARRVRGVRGGARGRVRRGRGRGACGRGC